MTGGQTGRFDCIDKKISFASNSDHWKKNSHFVLQNQEKKRGLCKSSTKELLSEWQHHRILSRDSSVSDK